MGSGDEDWDFDAVDRNECLPVAGLAANRYVTPDPAAPVLSTTIAYRCNDNLRRASPRLPQQSVICQGIGETVDLD